MKRLKKLIKRLFLLTVVVIVIAGCVLAGSGYKMYRDALNHQDLESKVAEIQSNPSYTTLSEMPELYLFMELAGRRKYHYPAACQKYVFHTGKELHPKDC